MTVSVPFSTCFPYFYSPPLGRDLWTRVRWPTGQRAATGGKVTTPGPMYGTNAASRHSSRMQMHSVTAPLATSETDTDWHGRYVV